MSDAAISCPNCGTVIPLSEAIAHQVQESLAREYDAKMAAKEREFTEMLQKEKQQLWAVAQEKAQEKMQVELEDMRRENAERKQQVEALREAELALRAEKRKMEEERRESELALARRLEEEKRGMQEVARKAAEEEFRLQMAAKDKQLEQLNRALSDAKQKSEQGSQQIQGDVQEDDLKAALTAAFSYDTVEDVKTGMRGADLVQRVYTQYGQEVGMLLWESKNTKNWQEEWIAKLKGDQVAAKADMCVLVSQVLPKGVEHFAQIHGIYVVSPAYALALAGVLRGVLLEVARIKQASEGKGEKMEQLYAYLSGHEFKGRIESVVMAFSAMKEDLESEKRSFAKHWAKREKELERVMLNTTGLYGDLQGIIGSSLPTISALELPLSAE